MNKANIVREIIDRFPTAPNQTIARIAFKENRAVFDSVENARNAVRFVRGSRGAESRKIAAKTKYFLPAQPGSDPFAAIPAGISQLGDWHAVQYDGPFKALILPDIHFPYHDRNALVQALDYGRRNATDFILLNGDSLDFYSVSFWERDPRRRKFADELEIFQEFLDTLRDLFPKARIVFKEGNHEERYPRYMRLRAPELLGVPDFELPKLLELEERGVEWVTEKRPIKLGDLNVLHGHEYKFNISNPVNPARGFYMRSKTLCLGSHLHQTSQHSEKNLEGKVISTWSTGCLCDLHPEYSPINNWNHGFAFVEVSAGGGFEVQNLRIIGGQVYR